MLFTFQEIIDAVIMTLAIGFIFMSHFGFSQMKSKTIDPIIEYYQKKRSFDWNALWTAAMVTAPAIILHELAHKLVAVFYGLNATFHAAYFWLGIGVIMKLLNTGFIFFVPAYVSHSGAATPLQSASIAFAGPFLNLILWFICWALLKFQIFQMSARTMKMLAASRYINGFLFIFNMIPLGFFDGAHVLQGLMQHFAA